MIERAKKLTQFASAFFLGFGSVISDVGAQSAGSWSVKSPMPAALNEVAVAGTAGKIHVIGGSVLGYTGPYHQQYDPMSDAWRDRSPLPRSLDHVGTAVIAGKIYAVGGFVGGATHKDGQNTAFEYDPALDTWRILAPMKVGRGSVGVVALDGKLHAIGGRTPDGRTVAIHEVYDPASNAWKEAAPLPKARDHFAIAVIAGKIHVAGGRFAGAAERTDLHDVYEPKDNSWTSAPLLPTPRSGLAGVSYKGLFLVLGGELPPGHTFSENEAFNTATNKWQTLAPMPSGRHATGAATDGNQVFMAGGSLKPGRGAVTEQLIVFSLP